MYTAAACVYNKLAGFQSFQSYFIASVPFSVSPAHSACVFEKRLIEQKTDWEVIEINENR